MDQYQSFIHKSRYARWLEEEKRRETWEETIARYIGFWQERGQLNDEDAAEVSAAIIAMECMPSMLCLMTCRLYTFDAADDPIL